MDCCGLDLLGADATTDANEAGAVVQKVSARIPASEVEAFQAECAKAFTLEFDTSATPEEARKMAERNLESTCKISEMNVAFLSKYAMPEERKIIVDAALRQLDGLASNPESTPKMKAIIESCRERIKGTASASKGTLSSTAKGAIIGASVGSVVAAAAMVALWRERRVLGAFLGGLVVGPSVGAASGAVIGAATAKPKQPQPSPGKVLPEPPSPTPTVPPVPTPPAPAPVPPVPTPPAPAPVPPVRPDPSSVKYDLIPPFLAKFKVGARVKGNDPTGKVQTGRVAKINYGSGQQVWVEWADGSASVANVNRLVSA